MSDPCTEVTLPTPDWTFAWEWHCPDCDCLWNVVGTAKPGVCPQCGNQTYNEYGPDIRAEHARNAPVDLRGDAVMDGGSWFASAKMDAPMVKAYRNTVKLYGNRRDWFVTPETARSMASALLHFADRAEAFHA